MRPFGSLCVLKGSYASVLVLISPYVSLCVLIGPCGFYTSSCVVLDFIGSL